MDPKSSFVQALDSTAVAPAVTAHSMLPWRTRMIQKEKWNDGVVAYSSAHLEDVASELIVHSAHSTQSEPETIEEVRRILLENL